MGSKMVQWVKALATKPDNLNSIPKLHGGVVGVPTPEGEREATSRVVL